MKKYVVLQLTCFLISSAMQAQQLAWVDTLQHDGYLTQRGQQICLSSTGMIYTASTAEDDFGEYYSVFIKYEPGGRMICKTSLQNNLKSMRCANNRLFVLGTEAYYHTAYVCLDTNLHQLSAHTLSLECFNGTLDEQGNAYLLSRSRVVVDSNPLYTGAVHSICLFKLNPQAQLVWVKEFDGSAGADISIENNKIALHFSVSDSLVYEGKTYYRGNHLFCELSTSGQPLLTAGLQQDLMPHATISWDREGQSHFFLDAAGNQSQGLWYQLSGQGLRQLGILNDHISQATWTSDKLYFSSWKNILSEADDQGRIRWSIPAEDSLEACFVPDGKGNYYVTGGFGGEQSFSVRSHEAYPVFPCLYCGTHDRDYFALKVTSGLCIQTKADKQEICNLGKITLHADITGDLDAGSVFTVEAASADSSFANWHPVSFQRVLPADFQVQLATDQVYKIYKFRISITHPAVTGWPQPNTILLRNPIDPVILAAYKYHGYWDTLQGQMLTATNAAFQTRMSWASDQQNAIRTFPDLPYTIQALKPGNYFLTYMDVCGTRSAAVNISSLDTLSALVIPGNFCDDHRPVLLNGNCQKLDIRGDGIINGVLYPDLAGEGLHTLYYTVDGPPDFQGTASFRVNRCTGSSAMKGLAQKPLFVYPNPCSDILHVEFPDNDPPSVDITDVYGNHIPVMIDAGRDALKLSFRGLPAGVYILHLLSEKGVALAKVIVP